MLSRQLVRPISIALTAVGVILVSLAIVYLAVKASQLPAFLPGHLAERIGKSGRAIRTHAHTKLGVALLAAAAATLASAWYIAYRYEPAD